MFEKNAFIETLIKALYQDGLRYFCLAPGKQSTFLALSLFDQVNIETFVHFDERSLAFHALGYAKKTGRPAPIITTSGSSLANLFPAVVEAYQESIPLLILSADRPYEERDCGSNQTLDQVKFFHRYVHWQMDLPAFDKNLPTHQIESLAHQALYYASKGPVHLNFQVREPFFDREKKQTASFNFSDYKTHSIAKKLSAPYLFDASKKGVFVCSKGVSEKAFLKIHALAGKLNWPVLSDILSFGRMGNFKQTIAPFENLLKFKSFQAEEIYHFGKSLSSKNLIEWIEKSKPEKYVCIHSESPFIHPKRIPFEHIPLSAEEFCSSKIETQNESTNWFNQWKKFEEKQNEILEEKLNEFSEVSVLRALLNQTSKPKSIFVGASMPIRHLSYFCTSKQAHQIYSNRGVSGIDGNLSTAFGLQQAINDPLYIIVGDLTFLYDLNALMQISSLKQKPTLIVLNNFGGSIFHHFPISENKELLSRFFQAKHPLSFEHLAKQFQLDYFNPKNMDAFTEAIQKASSIAKLIEVQTPSDQSKKIYQDLSQELQACYQLLNEEIPITL